MPRCRRELHTAPLSRRATCWTRSRNRYCRYIKLFLTIIVNMIGNFCKHLQISSICVNIPGDSNHIPDHVRNRARDHARDRVQETGETPSAEVLDFYINCWRGKPFNAFTSNLQGNTAISCSSSTSPAPWSRKLDNSNVLLDTSAGLLTSWGDYKGSSIASSSSRSMIQSSEHTHTAASTNWTTWFNDSGPEEVAIVPSRCTRGCEEESGWPTEILSYSSSLTLHRNTRTCTNPRGCLHGARTSASTSLLSQTAADATRAETASFTRWQLSLTVPITRWPRDRSLW